jgi:hypothetical protein
MFQNKRKNPNKTPHNTQKWTNAKRSLTSKSTWCVFTKEWMMDNSHKKEWWLKNGEPTKHKKTNQMGKP